jgi:hypothetical protein
VFNEFQDTSVIIHNSWYDAGCGNLIFLIKMFNIKIISGKIPGFLNKNFNLNFF